MCCLKVITAGTICVNYWPFLGFHWQTSSVMVPCQGYWLGALLWKSTFSLCPVLVSDKHPSDHIHQQINDVTEEHYYDLFEEEFHRRRSSFSISSMRIPVNENPPVYLVFSCWMHRLDLFFSFWIILNYLKHFTFWFEAALKHHVDISLKAQRT